MRRLTGAVLFTTTCLTITGTGAGGNSGDKSAGEQISRNRTRRKCPNGNGKEVLKRFGSKMSGVQIPSLRPKSRLKSTISGGAFFLCLCSTFLIRWIIFMPLLSYMFPPIKLFFLFLSPFGLLFSCNYIIPNLKSFFHAFFHLLGDSAILSIPLN